jgi:purine-binding chemotaxis protein CheW
VPRKKKTSQDTPTPSAQSDGGQGPLVDGVESPLDAVNGGRVVVFRLDEQLYALPVESVQEIQQIVELTPVPDTAPALVGMIDVRGRVVPAIDVRALIGLESRQYTLDTPMILCRAHGRIAALIVDEVEDVLVLPEGCMQAPSKLYALADRMLGISKLDIGLVIVLDPEKLVPNMALATASGDGGGLDL